jgi:hypothetical protein
LPSLLVAFLLKPALYVALFSAFAWAWPGPVDQSNRAWRPVAGGLMRAVLGLMVGLPLGLLVRDAPGMDGWVFTGLFEVLRFGLWLLVARWFLPHLPGNRLLLVALAGLLLNLAIDAVAMTESLSEVFAIRMC